MGRPEHLGPMARTLVETFAELTLPQQRRVFAMLQEIMETNERGAAAMAALGEIVLQRGIKGSRLKAIQDGG